MQVFPITTIRFKNPAKISRLVYSTHSPFNACADKCPLCCLCLEACVSSEMHYKNCVSELGKLLKPNGSLFMNGVLEQTFYFVGQEKFYTFSLTEQLVKEALNEAGIEIVKFVTIPVNYTQVADCKSLFYTYGRKTSGK